MRPKSAPIKKDNPIKVGLCSECSDSSSVVDILGISNTFTADCKVSAESTVRDQCEIQPTEYMQDIWCFHKMNRVGSISISWRTELLVRTMFTLSHEAVTIS